MEKRDKNRIYCLVDTRTPIRLNLREYCIEGWFLPQAALATIQRLKLRVDGLYSDVFVGLPRPDVANHFDDPEVMHCGFVARFRAPDIDPRVVLLVQSRGEEIILHEMRVDLASDRVRTRTDAVSGYFEWLTTYEPELFWPEHEIDARLSSLPCQPMISVIVPVRNAHCYFFERCLGSVLEQRYKCLDLCVCGDLSGDYRIRDCIHRLQIEDPRVQVMDVTGGIPAVCNRALLAVQGEIVVFLHENDELHPFALLEIVRRLNEGGGAGMIYSDEDMVDYLGRRSQPAFKPDFDMDAFLSFNYLGNLIALNRAIAVRIGGFRPACHGDEQWDFLLRFVEQIGPDCVQHISKPLYHRRTNPRPPKMENDLDSSAFQRTIAEHLERTGKRGRVESGIFCGSVRTRFEYPKNAKAAIFLRAEDGLFQTAVLRPNLKHDARLYEVVDCVIYRLDVDITKEARQQPRTFRPSDCPESARDSCCRPVISLDDMDEDVFIFINGSLETVNHLFIEELVSQAMRRECGLVTGISIDANSRILHSGFVSDSKGEQIDLFAGTEFPSSGYLGQLEIVRSVETISHHFFATRREHLLSVGGLACVSASRILQLTWKLTKKAAERNLCVLVTPYAVATFDTTTPAEVMQPYTSTARRVKLNPNLTAFSDLDALKTDHYADNKY